MDKSCKMDKSYFMYEDCNGWREHGIQTTWPFYGKLGRYARYATVIENPHEAEQPCIAFGQMLLNDFVCTDMA